MTTTNDIKVSVPVPVTGQMVSDLLISALMGGSNYWIEHIDLLDNSSIQVTELTDDPVNNLSQIIVHWIEGSCKISAGLHLELCFFAAKIGVLTGLKIMAEKYPCHFANIISENDDAETGDVFLQCCLFGEVRFA